MPITAAKPPLPGSPARAATTSVTPPQAQRILLIRPSALGDVCRTVPALATLRRAHPHAEIHWLVAESFAEAVRHHPDLNRVVSFPRHRFARQWYRPRVVAEALRWGRRLAGEGYDLTIDLQGLLRSGLFTRLTRARTRIGFTNAREYAWIGYNQTAHIDPNLHTVDRMLALLQAFGYPVQRDMRLYRGEHDHRWLNNYLDTRESYACIAPGARWLCKCWPIEHYGEIAARLHRSNIAGRKIIVLASPEERRRLQPLLSSLGLPVGPGNPIDCPQTTVGQMMALIAHCRLLVCNDSAPLHMAVGFGRPIAAVFGPTDPKLVGPYRRLDTVIQPPAITPEDMTRYRARKNDQSLIARVPVEDVWDTIVEQCNRGPVEARR